MSEWFPFYKGGYADSSKCCMICFHHAGGSAATFSTMKRFKTENFIAVPVEIPGHGRRLKEQRETDINILAEKTADAIYQEFGKCHLWLYGHSFGSLVAYETCFQLEHKYHKKVEKLIISGRNAPSESDSIPFHLSDGHDAFIREMKRYGLIPEAMLENEEFMKYYEPIVFGDYRLLENYHYHKNHKIKAPVRLDYGNKDEDISESAAEKWHEITSGSFSKYVHKGGHFFMFDKGNGYFDELIQETERRNYI